MFRRLNDLFLVCKDIEKDDEVLIMSIDIVV